MQHTPNPSDQTLFERYSAIVREKLQRMGVSALKDPEFMWDWLRMKQHAPEDFDDNLALYDLGLRLPVGPFVEGGKPTVPFSFDALDALFALGDEYLSPDRVLH